MAVEAKVKVWDGAVRAFHWTLVVLFFVAYFTGDEEDLLHVYAGYGVLALVAFRLVWGFIGTRHARFSDFIYGPGATLRYVRSLFSPQPVRYLGHNPLGGWMVVALLLGLVGACWSGLEAYGQEGHGPLAQHEAGFVSAAMANDDEDAGEEDEREGGAEGDEFWEEIHEALSNATLVLVFLHVAGVLIACAVHRENLVRSMITGYKKR